jgi:transposase-like protein
MNLDASQLSAIARATLKTPQLGKSLAKPNISAIAREHGVHRSTVQAWGKEGVLLGDPEAVKARVAVAKGRELAAGAAAGETYTEARRRREIALANRAEILAQREAGKVIDIDSVETAFGQIGAEFRSRLLAMRGNLVTELEGQGAEGIYRILDQRFGELLTAVHSLAKPQKP